MSEVLEGVGLVVAAGGAAAAILLGPGRPRAAAMLLALALFPILILADQWNSAAITDLREHVDRFVGLGLAILAAGVALAWAFRRWPHALPLSVIFVLPFRVPLEAGGETANLLVPLYVVIAAGTLATLARDWALGAEASRAGGAVGGTTPEEASATAGGGGSPTATGPARFLPPVLAAFVVLYALQALYSPDFSQSLQSVCFFFVPFSLLFVLLRDVEWDRRLLRWVLLLLAAEAVAFVAVGAVEHATRSLFWNEQVIRSNEFHTYFRVNSVFWDPNIYGRYLALAMTVAAAALLWARERRELALLGGLLGVLWLGLVLSFSQSSFIALLAGLAVLAAVRWSARWTAGAAAVAIVAGVLVIGLAGDSEIDFSRLNIDTGGRADLVSGGAELFSEHPLHGHGSGSFPTAYKQNVADPDAPVSESHTEPITVAAEQGLIGLAAYLALLVTAVWTMASPARLTVPRAAVLAAFAALLVHSLAYAGFFEDPIAWVLLAVGASLAAARPPRPSPG